MSFAFFAANPPDPNFFLFCNFVLFVVNLPKPNFLLRVLRAFVVIALSQCTFFNFCKLRSSRGGCKRWPMIVQETSPT